MPLIYDPYTNTLVKTDSQIEPVPASGDGDYVVRIYKGRAVYFPVADPVTIPVAENVPTITTDVSTVAGLRGEVNKILKALKDAGMMEEDPEPEPDPEDPETPDDDTGT